MTVEIFSLRPPFCLPRPGLVLQRIRKLRVQRAQNASPELERALEQFDLRPVSAIKRLDGAVRNETWVADTPEGRKVLKRYKTSLDYDQIVYEHSILEHLARNGFPAPRLAHTSRGDTIIDESGRYYAVLDYLDHYIQFHNYFRFPGQNRQFLAAEGRTLGLLHRALDGFTPAGSNQYGFQLDSEGRGVELDWYLEKFRNALKAIESTPLHQDYPTSSRIRERAGWIQNKLQEINHLLESSSLARGVIHGDYGPHNLLFRPGRPVVALDFELARRDWLLVDVISALSNATRPANPVYDLDRILPILTSYHSICPLPQEAIRLLPCIWQFQVMRRLMVTWSQYVEKNDPGRLVESQKRLSRLDWVLRHESDLANLYRLI